MSAATADYIEAGEGACLQFSRAAFRCKTGPVMRNSSFQSWLPDSCTIMEGDSGLECWRLERLVSAVFQVEEFADAFFYETSVRFSK